MNLDQELRYINEELEKMFSLTREFLRRSLIYYLSDENSRFDATIDDQQVNACERNVEAWCLSILLREKIYAADLRRVTGALKLVTDIERIGDHALDIREAAEKLKGLGEKNFDPQGIQGLVDYVLRMYDESVKCFVDYNVPLAEEICTRDNDVDQMYQSLLDNLIEAGEQGKVGFKGAVYQTLVLKYLQRIADHAVNIAEWTVYIKNGFHKDTVII